MKNRVVRSLLALALVAPPSFAADAAARDGGPAVVETRLEVRAMTSKDALLLLRTMAGIQDTTIQDERTLTIRATAERTELARTVLAVGESPEPLDSVDPVGIPDGEALAAFRVEHAKLRDVLVALRSEIGIRRVATNEGLRSIAVRDTPAQVEQAILVARRVEAAAE